MPLGFPAKRWGITMKKTVLLASLLAAAGAPVKAIQVQLGHASAEMTLNRYSHLYPDDLDELATHLDAIRRRADLSRKLAEPTRGDGGRSRDR